MDLSSWDQWKLTALTSRNRKYLAETWCRATTKETAIAIGEAAFQRLGIRGRVVVLASPYFPWKDSAFVGRCVGPEVVK